MNDNKKTILTDIIGLVEINSTNGRNRLIYNFNDIDIAFQEYEEDFKDDPVILKDIYECHRDVSNLYRTIIMDTINEFFDNVYGQSADFVLINYPQENISLKLEKYLKEKGIPQQFKSDIYANIKLLAERLNKRFSFDEVALINLIEASSGSNIILEEGSSRRHDNKIVASNNGSYDYKTSPTKKIYTHDGSKILSPTGQEREEKDNIQITSFPLGNKFANTDNAMKKIMEILFENLNLCIETYNSIYSAGTNVVENTALLSDGTTFNFEYIVNERNIPHLLGFQKGTTLNQKSLDCLNILVRANGRPRRRDGSLITLSQSSSPLDVLRVIYENQKNIIESGGLYEENGKKYEIINWEKVVLKTASFMRGDFFKTCFCLAKLAPDKYLVDSDERGGFVSISSTEYNKDLITSRSTRSVLNDLLNTRKQKRDFIFRGFKTTNEGQVVNSLVTGKAETIHIGKQNELLKTLQRFRELFIGSSNSGYGMQQGEIKGQNSGMPFSDNLTDKSELFGAIVEEIENEKFIRRFTPQEQAELGISISRDLSLVPHLSVEAMDVLQSVHNYNGAVTSTELDEFDNARSNGNKHKK